MWKKNELEMALFAAKRAIKKQIEDNPRAGVIAHRGEPEESRMRYTEALKAIAHIEAFFGMKGTSSWGICGSCTRFDQRAHSSKSFGACAVHRKVVHRYDSCNKHSVEGGGYDKQGQIRHDRHRDNRSKQIQR